MTTAKTATSKLDTVDPTLPPIARRLPSTATHHGVAVTDDYGWLRAANWQEVMREPSLLDTEIRAYLEAENAYTAALLADTEALQETLFQEMKARHEGGRPASAASATGPMNTSRASFAADNTRALCRMPRGGWPTRHKCCSTATPKRRARSTGTSAHSTYAGPQLLAYATDDKGSELYTIRIRDLETGKDLATKFRTPAAPSIGRATARRCSTSRLDAQPSPALRLPPPYRHAGRATIMLVYEEKDTGFYVGVGHTQSGRFILIDATITRPPRSI